MGFVVAMARVSTTFIAFFSFCSEEECTPNEMALFLPVERREREVERSLFRFSLFSGKVHRQLQVLLLLLLLQVEVTVHVEV